MPIALYVCPAIFLEKPVSFFFWLLCVVTCYAMAPWASCHEKTLFFSGANKVFKKINNICLKLIYNNC